ncbi:MAG: MFS transporter, partial [Verrucomicrobiales bacterium]|nr:MFS transporter [Verrucomicrobiales bacterium]
NLFVALQDVATDALAVDLLTPAERGRVNGFMYGSSYLGTSIAGAGLGLLMTRYGLAPALAVQVVAILLIMLVPLLVRERPSDVRFLGTADAIDPDTLPQIPFTQSLARFTTDLVTAFREKSAWLAALFAALLKIPIGIISVMLVVLTIQRLGWTKEEYDIVMSVTNWFGLGGALVGGFLADRFGVRRIAATASLTTAAVWLAFGLLSSLWTSKIVFQIFLCTHELLVSILAVSCFAMFMGIAAKKVAATQFSTYMAVFNLSQSFGSKAAGWLDTLVPAATVFILLAVFQAAITPILIGIRPHQKNHT